jgi:hypothetical protein
VGRWRTSLAIHRSDKDAGCKKSAAVHPHLRYGYRLRPVRNSSVSLDLGEVDPVGRYSKPRLAADAVNDTVIYRKRGIVYPGIIRSGRKVKRWVSASKAPVDLDRCEIETFSWSLLRATRAVDIIPID